MPEFKAFHSLQPAEVFHRLESGEKGLSSREAEKRLKIHGLNAIRDEHKISALKIFIDQFKSFLVFLLLLAAGISFILSFQPGFEEHLVDVFLILIIVLANAFFGFFQDFKAEQSISALKKMSSLSARVIRGGIVLEIDSSTLVPGDILLLEEGSIVPADARLIEAVDLKINEAMLTGESLPVGKSIETVPEKTLLHGQKNMLFMNTIVSRGKAKAVVTGTGMNTEVGKIAESISSAEEKTTPFEEEINVLGKKIAFAVIIIIAVIFLTQFFLNKGVSILTLILVSISLAVAAVPEGLPAVVTLSLAIGTRKMLTQNALVRKLSVIESIGAVNVICSDKTGTLTKDKMTVSKIFFNNKVFDADSASKSDIDLILLTGLLCNDCVYSVRDGKKVLLGDATEKALVSIAESKGFSLEKAKNEFKLLKEIPFTSERRLMSNLHKKGSNPVIYTKGAFEEVISRCDSYLENGLIKPLTRAKIREFDEVHNDFSSQALRVLGFAFREINSEKEFKEENLVFLGLQGMIDPPRDNVLSALNDCREAGIRIIMITGDNKLTAQAIGKTLGFRESVIEGKTLNELNHEQLKNIVMKTEIFARTLPEQKTMILKALQEQGFVVGMTGDGINDAPALKNSDVGISMGIKGTDVTKQASDMVLLDDNFITIRNSIAEGRNIFRNIQKFVNYLLSANAAEILVIFLASLLGYGLALTAVQILWINLLTDGLPALALGFDPKPKGIMKEKPHKKEEGIIDKSLTFSIAYTGVTLGAVILALFIMNAGDLIKAQTIAFTALVFFELIRLYFVRARYNVRLFSNKWLYGAVILTVSLQLLILFNPFLRELFKLAVLSTSDFMEIFLAGILFSFLMFAGLKIERFLT